MNQVIEVVKYEDFLPESEIDRYESDMEEGEYVEWIEEYPEHTLSIFGSYLELASNNLITEGDIVYFVNEGINLNVLSNAFCSYDIGYTTALIFACKNRNKNLIELLIMNGADINKKDISEITPLETLLIPSNGIINLNIEELESCVKIFINSGAKLEIRKFIFDNYCKLYFSKSEYIKSVLENAIIVA